MKTQSNPNPQIKQPYISKPTLNRTAKDLIQILIDECNIKLNDKTSNHQYYLSIIKDANDILNLM